MPSDRDTPVVLSRIYTRTGDDGSTSLGDMSRTSKNDPRLVAYADVDEANCALGVALVLGAPPADVAELLAGVQNDLFDVGADLCRPVDPEREREPGSALRITPDYIDRLEAACDLYNERLEPLRSFVLPGGTTAAALLHTARAVVRRAERSAWAAVEAFGDGVATMPAQYLNRLSDLLFILARVANAETGDVVWKPGGGR